jgi:hypothetical protein
MTVNGTPDAQTFAASYLVTHFAAFGLTIEQARLLKQGLSLEVSEDLGAALVNIGVATEAGG